MRVRLMQRRRSGSVRRDERGGVAIVVAGLIVPFCLLTAFTLDLGMAYAQAQAFASGADSAALAIARAKQNAINAKPGMYPDCASVVSNDGGQAKAIAIQQANANRPYGLTADGATPDVLVDVDLSCVGEDGKPKSDGVLKVDVTVNRDVPTTLGRLAGVDSIHAEKTASAGLSGSTKVGGVFPLAICDQVADAIQADASVGPPYTTTTIETDKVWHPGCASQSSGGNGNGKGNGNGGKGGSGNWGWLDCGTSNGNGQPELLDGIADGCALDFSLSGIPPTLLLDGTPGNRFNPQVSDAVQAVVGKTYAFPVYDLVTGHGSGATYRIVGFLSLEIKGTSGDEIQVEYVAYSPVGEFTAACGLGDPDCNTYSATAVGLIG